MKHRFNIISGVFAASILAFPAPAKDAPQPPAVREGVTAERTTATPRDHSARPDRLNAAVKASDVIGMTVNNYQNEKLGKVTDLALDVESGRIVQVVLSTGGFLGVGDTHVGLPPGSLHHDAAAGVLHLDATRQKIESAPKLDMTKWEECCSHEQLTRVYRHYGAEPALWFVDTEGKPVARAASKEGDSDPTAVRAEIRKQAQNLAPDVDRSTIPASRLGHSWKASRLMGMPVKNLQEENLGKVENFLLDLPAGRVVAVVVSSGGFIGIGDELSAVPPAALRFSEDQHSLVLDASKELLTQAPHFTANRWPDFSQAAYSHGVYRAYRIQPYFTTNSIPDSGPSARFVRDSDDRLPTASDQGTSVGDLDITTRIRQGIVDDKSMSVGARNVKIVTRDGQVTLRGAVDTADEKRLIGDIANGIALVANVHNYLEVR